MDSRPSLSNSLPSTGDASQIRASFVGDRPAVGDTGGMGRVRRQMTLLVSEPAISQKLVDFQEITRQAGLCPEYRKLIHLGQDLETEVDPLPGLRRELAYALERNVHLKRFSLRHRIETKLVNTLVTISYLLCLGVSAGIVSFSMDLGVHSLIQGRMYIYNYLEGSAVLQYLAWTAWIVMFTFFSTLVTWLIGPQAAGSGIPEIKSYLSGVSTLDVYLRFRVLVAKVVGLTLSLGAGLLTGKEGPFVHTGAVLAAQLLRIPLFSRLKENTHLMRQMIATGAASGVSACFGTPIGGVLFSVEVTSTYYPVKNYWKSFLTSVSAGLVFVAFLGFFTTDRSDDFTTLFNTTFTGVQYNGVELVFFALLGVICGVLGAGFIRLNELCMRLRKYFSPVQFVTRQSHAKVRFPMYFSIVISFFTALWTFPRLWGLYAGVTSGRVIEDCLSPDPLTSERDWDKHSIWFSLIYMWIMRSFMSPLSITVPAPVGMFGACLTIGACVGRLVGEILSSVLPSGGLFDLLEKPIVPGGYAVVAAAAYAGAVTHTISAGVIMLEVTGQLNFALPVLISTILAIGTCSIFSESIYNRVIHVRPIPFLPDVVAKDPINRTVGDYMVRDVAFLTLDATHLDLERILSRYPDQPSYPIVESRTKRTLCCAVVNEMLRAVHNRFLREHHLETLEVFAHRVVPGGIRHVLELEESDSETEEKCSSFADTDSVSSEEVIVEPSSPSSPDMSSASEDLAATTINAQENVGDDVEDSENEKETDGFTSLGVSAVADEFDGRDEHESKTLEREKSTVRKRKRSLEGFRSLKESRDKCMRCTTVSYYYDGGYVLDAFPTILTEDMPVVHAQLMFTVNRLHEAYVANNGILVGVLYPHCIDESMRHSAALMAPRAAQQSAPTS